MSILDLLPILITVFGLYMLIKLRFFFVIHPIKTAKRTFALFRDKSSRASLFLALAGTLGVGNIVGVAYGISVGGVGSIFWIFVSSIFAAVIKYSESALAADKKENDAGGMMYVIKSSFGKFGASCGAIYAVLCIFLSFSMGSALQAKSFVSSLSISGKLFEYIVALLFAVATFAVIIGGAEKISRVTSVVIPISTVVYIFMCLGVIIINVTRLPVAIKNIIEDAFNFRSMGGGVSAFFTIKSLKEGYARGLLSNEAGAGTSSMAESRSNTSAADVGLLGILEVFFDTTLLCTLTGLSVVVSGISTSECSGMQIISGVFSEVFGGFGNVLLAFLIFSFAFSTVLCWYYYGTESFNYLSVKRKSVGYTVAFVFFAFIGFIIPENILIAISDYLLFFMSVITVCTLYKNSERIFKLSERYGLLKYSDSGKRSKTKSRNRVNL